MRWLRFENREYIDDQKVIVYHKDGRVDVELMPRKIRVSSFLVVAGVAALFWLAVSQLVLFSLQ